jgi:hypothetical protein
MRRDAALIAGALALCPIVAALAPAEPPLARTRALVSLERALGVFVEPAVHAWVAARPALLTAAGLSYVWVHLPATIGALIWARLERPHAFVRARDTFLATQLVTVAGYLLVPVAPPRMLPGFTDTLAVVYGIGGERLAHSVQSPYAAIPSGHVAFAAVAARDRLRARALARAENRRGALRRAGGGGDRRHGQPSVARRRGRPGRGRPGMACRQSPDCLHPSGRCRPYAQR